TPLNARVGQNRTTTVPPCSLTPLGPGRLIQGSLLSPLQNLAPRPLATARGFCFGGFDRRAQTRTSVVLPCRRVRVSGSMYVSYVPRCLRFARRRWCRTFRAVSLPAGAVCFRALVPFQQSSPSPPTPTHHR